MESVLSIKRDRFSVISIPLMSATDAFLAPPEPKGGWGGLGVASKKEIDIKPTLFID
jgi:hypothetical protein